jgi:hypothetical protein
MKDVGENARSAAVISSPSVLCGMAVMPYRTWSYGVTILIFLLDADAGSLSAGTVIRGAGGP